MEINWQQYIERVSASLARSYGLEMWLAVECTHRAFEKVYAKHQQGKIRSDKAVLHYLFISAKNEFLHQLDESIPIEEHHGYTPEPDYAGKMDREAHLEKLERCIDMLPYDDARLIRITLEQPEISMAELAVQFNTTAGAMRVRKYRATHKLRNLYIGADMQQSKKKDIPQTLWRRLKEYFSRTLKPGEYRWPSLFPDIKPSTINSNE